MRNYLIILLITLLSCNSPKKSYNNDFIQFDPFPLEVPEANSLMSQWEKKQVLETKLIDDMENNNGWEVTGIGKMNYTEERAKDGKRSLRFSTSLRDEEHYRKNRSKWGSFEAGQGGSSSVKLSFNEPQDWAAFNRISFWIYVHPTSMPTYSFNLRIENEGSVQTATTSRRDHFIQDLKPGIWNHVLFEMPHLERNKVKSFVVNQILRGHNPEEEGIVTYDIDQLELQRVITDQYEGWNTAPGKISYNHIGYKPSDLKIAITGNDAAKNFQLVDQNNNVIFSGDIKTVENRNGIFNLIDFSEFKTEGLYRIKCGSLESNQFPINEEVWIQPLFKALNFYYCERCGYNVPGIHLECHKDWQGFRGDTIKIINGGWHDAGDLSQGYWRTAMAVYAMLINLDIIQNQNNTDGLSELIRSEIAWGLEWLLKVRFGDGYHMSWSTMRIYSDNKVGTIDDVLSPAQNVPWENFLSAAVLCKSARILKKTHPELANKAYLAAIEDWEAGAASRKNRTQAEYREAAWGTTSSILLGKMTNEDKYKEYAVLFGKLLIQCQEQNFLDRIPVTGYFYSNTERIRVIHNYHAAFEEAPLIALTMLCREYPEHENWIDWYSAVVLYSEFFLKRGSKISSPYCLLPNSVWKRQEIMAEKDEKIRQDLLRQFNEGTRLNDEYVLRTFPIYYNDLFHGNTNIQMSGNWALAEASRLRCDSAGMQLVGKQLEWILGANPFSQSLMYGVGYDFAPHFAYCLKDVVGSLPVGMDCMSGDDPFWSGTNTATYKEIWIEPVSRFLGAVSIYGNYKSNLSDIRETGKDVLVQTETTQADNGSADITITLTGTGKHEVAIRTFNSLTDMGKQMVKLSADKPATITARLTGIDQNKPYVAVIIVDNNPDLCWEILGSFIKPSF